MATEKQKKALRPIAPVASEASYEAFVTGVGENREYEYTSGKGFVATNKPNAVPNVFSTYARELDGSVTTQELINDRIQNADAYAEEAQKISAVISGTMPRYFNKSSYVGSIADLAAFTLEGAKSTVGRTFAAGYNLPDTVENIKLNDQLSTMVESLTDESKENVEAALRKQYDYFLNPANMPEGATPTSTKQAYKMLSWANVDNMTGKDGQALTEKEKSVISKLQEVINSNSQIERNRMADAWFGEMLEKQTADSFVNPGMGAKGLRMVGNAAGNILVSGLTFAAVGAAPELAGMGAATTAAKFGAGQLASGARLGIKAAKLRGIASKYAAVNNIRKAEQYAHLAKNAQRWSNYKMGVGSYVTNNFPQMVALSSIMGRGAVFSQSFLTQFTDVRNELIAKGATPEQATSAAIAAGFAEGSIETLVGFRFLNRFLTEQRSFKNYLFKAVIPEGLEELGQTAAENAITKATGFNDATYSDIAAEMVFSFIGGALGGAAFGAGSYNLLSEGSRLERIGQYVDAREKAMTPKQQQALNKRIEREQANIAKEYDAKIAEIKDAQEKKRLQEERDARIRSIAEQAQADQLQGEAEFEQSRYSSTGEQVAVSGFTAQEENILSQLREEYEERARTVNPDITAEQVENGWKGVRALLLHEGYTGEFITAANNAIDNMISFSTTADQVVKENLNNLINTLGLTPDEADAATRITSKDGVEAYNAELDVMEDAIVRDFKLAGAETEGKAFAKIFRNQLGTLPLFAKDEDGNPMTPLSFYEAIKPRIINIQNSIMHNQEVRNVENIMYEATRQFDSEENYHSGNRWQYRKAYDKYQNILGMITAYSQADKANKKVLLANINLALFNAYNYTSDVDFIDNYIQARQAKEYAVVHELGMDAGKKLSNEDYAILALMRQKGLSFAFSAKAIGLASTSASNDALNARYEAKLNDLFPPITESDLNWIERISTAEGIGREPQYRDVTVDTADQNRATYDAAATGENKIAVTKAEQQALDQAAEAEGVSSKFINPNALYARDGKVILVVNGKNQGEFLHEAGHYMITEFLLQNMEMGAITGDRALGPVNQLLISLYNSVKGDRSVRLNQIQRQETILDALMDFIRTDGHTGNREADEILTELQGMLNDEILHPEGSKYERLPEQQKKLLRENIRNLFKPTTSMEMLNAKVELNNKINNADINTACQAALEYVNKYAIPDIDNLTYKLSDPTADYISKRAALEQVKNNINLQAISLMLGNDEELQAAHDKIGFSKKESEDIAEDAIFQFAEQQKKDAPAKIARQQLTARERGEKDVKDLPKNLKKFGKAIASGARALFTSLVDQGNRLSPELGSVIQRVMYDEGKMRTEGQSYGKRFMDAFAKKQKSATPISQADYDINFVDKINNYKISEAREWLLSQFQDEESRKEIQEAFDGMINWMDSMKEVMKVLDVHPETGWMDKSQFFPRSVENYEAFSDFIDKGPKNMFDQVARKVGAAEDKTAKEQRKAQYEAQRLFAQLAREGEHANRVKFLNERVVREVTPELRQFYKDPIDAYMDYVEDVCLTITTRKLIGADKGINFWDEETGQLKDMESAALIYNALNNGGYIYQGRLDTTGLTDEQKEEVRKNEANVKEFMKALNAYITRHKEINPMMKFTNDFLTATMLGHLSTAASQGFEMVTTAFDFGLKNVFEAAFDVAKGKSKLTIKDLNIEELDEQYRPLCEGTVAAVTNGVLKYTGFKLFDVYFKNVAINSIYNYFENSLKNPNSAEFNEAMDLIAKSFAGDPDFENRQQKLLEDIKNRKISDDIKFLVYNIFARQQPINAANISYGYNAVNSVGRLCLYKFNTVAYKQTARIANRLKTSFVDANGNVDMAKGTAAVLRFMLYCALIGIPLDTIKNILNGKMEFSPKKSFIFSVGQAFLINEYEAHIMQSQGLGSMVAGKFAPPFTIANAWWKDATSILPGGKEYRAQSLKWVPGLRPVHNWLYSITTAPNDSDGYDFDLFNTIEDDLGDLWG